jgi:hypothetical protein
MLFRRSQRSCVENNKFASLPYGELNRVPGWIYI